MTHDDAERIVRLTEREAFRVGEEAGREWAHYAAQSVTRVRSEYTLRADVARALIDTLTEVE